MPAGPDGLSLVSCLVALYPTTSGSEKISFNQLNRQTGHRIEVGLLKGIIKVIAFRLGNKGITIIPPTISRMELEARLLPLNAVSPDFPWKRSECLLLFLVHFSRRNVKPLRPMSSLMRQEQLRYFLMGNAEQEGFFERFGHTEDDGDQIHVTSRWPAMDHKMSTLGKKIEVSK